MRRVTPGAWVGSLEDGLLERMKAKKAQHRTRTDDPFLTMDRGPADGRARDASQDTESPGTDGEPG
jgi:hypothetical protein